MADDPMFEGLGMNPMPVAVKTKPKTYELIPQGKTEGDRLQDDLDEVRINIKNLLEKGELVFDDLMDFAASSRDPKVYREVTVLLKVLVDANGKLIDAAEARTKNIKPEKELVDERPNMTQNNIYVGSRADLLKTIDNDEKN